MQVGDDFHSDHTVGFFLQSEGTTNKLYINILYLVIQQRLLYKLKRLKGAGGGEGSLLKDVLG